jgi:zinc transporter, ZIP family
VASAFWWGVAAATSLLIGALFALRAAVASRILGLIMGFGSGVLISAVAYELVEEAARTSHGDGSVAIGLFLGALTYYVGDVLLDRMQVTSAAEAQASGVASSQAMTSSPVALALVLGIVLDGIPESIVLGLTVLSGEVSVAILVAVFISNFPEGLAATSELRSGGWTINHVMLLWLGIVLVSGLASWLGFTAFDHASNRTVAIVTAFAGGAILTMLADTMMPEAFAKGGKLVGLCTVAGFALAFAVSEYS